MPILKVRYFGRRVNEMQINPIDVGRSVKSGNDTLKVGQTQSVSIKERLSSNEAIISFKGKEMKAYFENGVPNRERVQVMVKDQTQDTLSVKVMEGNQSSQVSKITAIDSSLKIAGFDPVSNPELKEAAQVLLNKGYPLTKDTLQSVHQFLKTETGSYEQKLAAIEALAQKQLEVALPSLKAIHIALNGAPLTDVVKNISNEIPDFDQIFSRQESQKLNVNIRDLIQSIKNQPNIHEISKQVLDFLKNATNLSKYEKNAIMQALKETSLPDGRVKLIQILQTIDQAQIKQTPSSNAQMDTLLKAIGKETSLKAVMAKVNDFISSLDKQDTTGLDKLTNSLNKAAQLLEKGRELSARKELASGLTKFQDMNPQLHQPAKELSLSDDEQSLLNQAIQGLQLGSKDIVVTEISKKLSQMAIDFKQIKRDVSRHLDQSIKLIENQQPQAKQLLESTIKQIDKALLKGEFMLYADMSTEKKLMQASSSLAEAKNLLSNGQMDEASKLVKEIKNTIEAILFKPSDVKVKHFVPADNLLRWEGDTQEHWKGAIQADQSGRHVFELIRKLGLMNEREAGQSLIARGNQPEISQNINLKASLLGKLHSDDLHPKLAQQVEQAVNHITGQQLLNKPDSSGIQNLSLQLPLLLHKEVENVKVFINSQSDKEQIDWENCSLYFVMETRRLGEIGISLTATNRNLFVTFKSDKTDMNDKLLPLTDSVKERLQEVGYTIGSLQVKPMTERESLKSPTTKHHSPALSVKGYDFTV